MPNSLPYHKPLKFVSQETSGNIVSKTYERGNVIIDIVTDTEIVNVTLVPFNHTTDMDMETYEKLCYLENGKLIPSTMVLTYIMG